MKKITLVVALLLSLALVLAACGTPAENDNDYDYYYGYDNDSFDWDNWEPDLNDNDPWGGGEWVDPTGNPDPYLVELMHELYAGVEDLPMVENFELTAANFSHFVFIDYIEGSRGIASQALISAIPHAVVLLQLPEGANASAVAAEMEAAADPAMWICVEAEKMAVFHSGNYVVMAMSFEAVVDGVGANVPNALG
ncbi:MAG: hypothetical protein FWD06_02460 [Oscillospiraceae bacterium]|nr:hypothetical protein [Oscillospiraceae bacterium]